MTGALGSAWLPRSEFLAFLNRSALEERLRPERALLGSSESAPFLFQVREPSLTCLALGEDVRGRGGGVEGPPIWLSLSPLTPQSRLPEDLHF